MCPGGGSLLSTPRTQHGPLARARQNHLYELGASGNALAGHANYATAKGGLKMLMQSMAQELAPEKIRVNGIAPGAIKTAINKDAMAEPRFAIL